MVSVRSGMLNEKRRRLREENSSRLPSRYQKLPLTKTSRRHILPPCINQQLKLSAVPVKCGTQSFPFLRPDLPVLLFRISSNTSPISSATRRDPVYDPIYD